MQAISFEVRIQLPGPSGVAAEILFGALAANALSADGWIVQELREGAVCSRFFPDRKAAGEFASIVRRLGNLKSGVRIIGHNAAVWQTRWKKGWKPFDLTGRVRVIPLWQPNRQCPRRMIPLYLETTSAFGTGLHETTSFTARLIEEYAPGAASFLDIGTGSGILTVLAGKLGISRIKGVDYDRAAVKVAKNNLLANGLRPGLVVTADIRSLLVRRAYDLVAANLVTSDLIAWQRQIAATLAPGGHLVVSGISLANLDSFLRKFRPGACTRVKVVSGLEWAAVVYRRKTGH